AGARGARPRPPAEPLHRGRGARAGLTRRRGQRRGGPAGRAGRGSARLARVRTLSCAALFVPSLPSAGGGRRRRPRRPPTTNAPPLKAALLAKKLSSGFSVTSSNTLTCGPVPGPAPVTRSARPSPLTSAATTRTPPAKEVPEAKKLSS